MNHLLLRQRLRMPYQEIDEAILATLAQNHACVRFKVTSIAFPGFSREQICTSLKGLEDWGLLSWMVPRHGWPAPGYDRALLSPRGPMLVVALCTLHRRSFDR